MKAVTHNLLCSESQEDQILEKNAIKIKSLGDDGYFGSYSHFGIHLEMLSVRNILSFHAILYILQDSSHYLNRRLLFCGL